VRGVRRRIMKKITFMNVPLCTVEGTFRMTEITVAQAKELCQQADELGSAIGHQGAADAIKMLLGVEVSVNRIQYEQNISEDVIVIKLMSRMPEGCGNLTLEQMNDIGFKFFFLEHIETEQEKEERIERLHAEKVAAGWREFHFFSSYCGSHEEYGEGDYRRDYLFAPTVIMPIFGSFQHGHRGQDENNDNFDNWLEALEEGVDYIIKENNYEND